ncbi:uncharacterized protein [Amphiura filiformis]|uniref:uncharacterized protein n=1 Tax=Amphiura filiformis TaxID=82378 RepID=UPI003B2268B3
MSNNTPPPPVNPTAALDKEITVGCGHFTLEKLDIKDTHTLIIVIEDPGEECDDEANKAMMNRLAKGGIKVIYLAVNGDKTSRERLARCDDMKVSPPQDSRHAKQVGLEDWDTTCLMNIGDLANNLDKKGRVVVQHNAPVFGEDEDHVEGLAYHLEQAKRRGYVDFVYFTQGTFGKCVNSADGKGKKAASRLKRKAKDAFYTDSTKNMMFSYNSAKALGEGVLRVSGLVFVQNTLARAPAHGFCRHLVGPRGANYNSTKSMYTNAKKDTNPEWDAIKPSPKAIAAAEAYCDPKNPENFAKAEEFSASKREMLKQTRQDQIDGLAKMLQAFNVLFGIDEGTVLYSSDKRWENADKGGEFYGIYKAVLDAMKDKPDAEWSPAYDPTCAALVYAFLCDESASKKSKVAEWFDVSKKPEEDDIFPATWKGVATLGEVTKEMTDGEF